MLPLTWEWDRRRGKGGISPEMLGRDIAMNRRIPSMKGLRHMKKPDWRDAIRIETIVNFLKQHPEQMFTPLEIAKHTGMTYRAVRHTLQRIRRKYRDLLREGLVIMKANPKRPSRVYAMWTNDLKKYEEIQRKAAEEVNKWKSLILEPVPPLDLPKEVKERLINIVKELDEMEFETWPSA
jgi:hypothetical protein